VSTKHNHIYQHLDDVMWMRCWLICMPVYILFSQLCSVYICHTPNDFLVEAYGVEGGGGGGLKMTVYWGGGLK
jgi:hypothetical protein